MKKYGTNDGGDATTRQKVTSSVKSEGAPSDSSEKYNSGAEAYLRGNDIVGPKQRAEDAASKGVSGSD